MYKIMFVAALGLALSAALAAQESEWKEFASKEGAFKVLLLGTPREEEQQVQSLVGPLVNHLFIAQAPTNDTVYLVSYAEYPDDALKQHTPDQLLDAARSGTLEKLKGRLLSDQKITLDKAHPGREFLIDIPGTAQYRARIYFAQKRLYQVVCVTSSKGQSTSKETEGYFDSFHVIAK